MNEEIWRPVVGYEGIYEVSDQGRIRSLARLDTKGRRVNARILRLKTDPRGYQQVNLHRDRKMTAHRVHRIVLAAFVGPAPEGTEGCHYDGNPSNNRASNLRWDTRSANNFDKRRHGTASRGGRRSRGANGAVAR